MQAVILAAGLGTRMGDLTKNTPKVMLKFKGKNLLEWKIEALPKEIDEVILVVGYKSEVIKKYFGDEFQGRKISYVEDTTLTGTAPALWYAKDLLKDKFLVMMGDDIYSKDSIAECAKTPLSICCKVVEENDPASRVLIKNKSLAGFVLSKDNLKLKKPSNLAFTGLYCLTKEIFRYKPAKIEGKEEWGLPHTLLKLALKKRVRIVKTTEWKQISSPDDLI
jgi:NDP-sugar pyrophosphorylase family protein